MFKKLRNKIIIITMTITTAVLVAAGGSVMFFSSTIRPEPRPVGMPFEGVEFNAAEFDMTGQLGQYTDQELKDFIKSDRREGSGRLLVTLLGVGMAVEVIAFVISYYLSEKIVAPVRDSYDKQKKFIANASHELKTPLAVIEANMEALEVDSESEQWKKNIETEITHANKLVLDLLQLARMDAGSIARGAVEEVNMEAVVRERAEIFKPKFAGKITAKTEGENMKYTLPKQDLVQVVDILLDNATKYGEKKIAIMLKPGELTVANDGAKVKQEDLEKIFDRFYQTDKTKEGSGLGLAIAKAICEQNGWKVACESNKKVTQFSVKIPYQH